MTEQLWRQHEVTEHLIQGWTGSNVTTTVTTHPLLTSQPVERRNSSSQRAKPFTGGKGGAVWAPCGAQDIGVDAPELLVPVSLRRGGEVGAGGVEAEGDARGGWGGSIWDSHRDKQESERPLSAPSWASCLRPDRYHHRHHHVTHRIIPTVW